MQDFLQAKQLATPTATPTNGQKAGKNEEREVELRVQLPDKTVVTVSIREFWRTTDVYRVRVGGGGNREGVWIK